MEAVQCAFGIPVLKIQLKGLSASELSCNLRATPRLYRRYFSQGLSIRLVLKMLETVYASNISRMITKLHALSKTHNKSMA